MELVSVIVAAVASFAFGAVWYMVLGDRWMAAAGVAKGEDGRPANAADKSTYIIALICALIVAGMMRHIFGLSGIDGAVKGLVAGFGIGAFLATPWLVTNYTFADKPSDLKWIDGGYATFGCTVMGLVLGIL
ncbi:DUF1761 domain-containing protein [Shimia biformata]|uniref:DUF1761 domain-containing protein n=1 Tax=Shimia biformata TaxID=1294299 RepID=UPI0019516AEE|nr:DUF1761 domain-containing protein [Shimia biformata]